MREDPELENFYPYLREVFPAPPLTAYKVSRNLGTFLIRARIPRPVPIREQRVKNGMHKCMKNLRGITCKKCMMQYIGTSKLTAQARLSQHAGYIRNKNLNQPTGKHFNLRGHSLSDTSFVILEKVFNKDVLLREERESHYIRLFNTKFKGMNIKT